MTHYRLRASTDLDFYLSIPVKDWGYIGSRFLGTCADGRLAYRNTRRARKILRQCINIHPTE